MIEIFKTNVQNKAQARIITAILQNLFPVTAANFDLADDDKILRVEAAAVHPDVIVKGLAKMGFTCELLN